MNNWTRARSAGDVEREGVIPREIFPREIVPREIDGHDYAVYRSPDNGYYATDGRCTHQRVLRADGLATGHVIGCPTHNGWFDYTTGSARRAPVTADLRTDPVKVEGGFVLIDIESAR